MQKVSVADGSTYWEYVFEKTTFEQDWGVPETTLAALGEAPAEPLSPNGHAPTPEVHDEGEAPQIAPEPAQKAPLSAPVDGRGAPFAPPHAGALTPAMEAYLRASDRLIELLTHPEGGIVAPKEPELILIIVETIKGVKKLRELLDRLHEREGDNRKTLTWAYRVLRACMWGHVGVIHGLATFRGHSLEGKLPHPKESWAVVRRVLQELEGVLNGEEVSLWPLPELRTAPTGPAPTLPPIEAEPKWREAWELFAQIPPGHPARLAILKGQDPDPVRDWEYYTRHLLIRSLLNGEAIDPPF